MTVSDNTIQAETLGSFFKVLGRISAKAGMKLASFELKTSGRALEITSDLATAAATKIPEAVLSSLPEVIIFYHTDEGFYPGIFVWFYAI